MQFINFPPAKIGTKAQENTKPDTCIDCNQPLGNAESMVRNGGALSHLDACPPRNPSEAPKLALDERGAEKLAYSGRSWPALKASKQFDSERLASSPLFERRLFHD